MLASWHYAQDQGTGSRISLVTRLVCFRITWDRAFKLFPLTHPPTAHVILQWVLVQKDRKRFETLPG